jgi:TRAP transporter TAXI family solute receptor
MVTAEYWSCRFGLKGAWKWFLLITFWAWLWPATSQAYDLLLGTGPPDSFSYFAGKTICRLLGNQMPETGCRTVAHSDSSDTLTNVQSGSLDLALVSSLTIHDALHREGKFQYVAISYDDLRLVTPLYRTPIAILARADAKVNSFNDLENKRFNGGTRMSLTSHVLQDLLEEWGWGLESFSLYQQLSESNGQDFLALQNGSVQAMLHIGMHPDRDLVPRLSSHRYQLVPISLADGKTLIRSKTGYTKCPLDQENYGLRVPAVTTLGMETLLISSAAADDETVNQLLETLYTARGQLRLAHPSFLREKVDVATLNNSYLHPHPAAILFFQENLNRF